MKAIISANTYKLPEKAAANTKKNNIAPSMRLDTSLNAVFMWL